MNLTMTTPPTEEPVTIPEIRRQLRSPPEADNDLLSQLRAAARETAEAITKRQFMAATYTLKIGAFSDLMRLPNPPLQSVTSIKYYDVNGVQQTLGTDVYDVETGTDPGQIVLAYGESWPAVQAKAYPIEIVYVAGYASADAVPDAIKAAILMLIAHFYLNPEPVIVGTIASELPLSVEMLLQSVEAPFVT